MMKTFKDVFGDTGELVPFGTKLYQVEEINKRFSAKKLEMVDDDGNRWYRYEEPPVQFNINEYKYVGCEYLIVNGRKPEIDDFAFGDPSYNNVIVYFFETIDAEGVTYAEDFAYDEQFDWWFFSIDDAEAFIKERKDKLL